MKELLRTNDVVLLSFAESVLRDAGIEPVVADREMSVIDGSLNIVQRRILVSADRLDEARTLLAEAGVR